MYIDPTKSYFDQVLAPLAALGPDELTLGSELDSSVYEFPGQWVEVRNRLGLGGHKLNHDALDSARSSIKSEINAERSKRGLSRRWALPDIDDYLGTLDYKAVSWYVPDWRPLPAGYVIGELGLGSTDITRPWHFDASHVPDAGRPQDSAELVHGSSRLVANRRQPESSLLLDSGSFRRPRSYG